MENFLKGVTALSFLFAFGILIYIIAVTPGILLAIAIFVLKIMIGISAGLLFIAICWGIGWLITKIERKEND
jgi:hypothetical protein